MNKQFLCKYCNYNTNIHYSFTKHLSTKKHIFNYNKIISPQQIEFTKKEENNVTKCLYCDKIIKYSKNISRHINLCKKKK